MTHPTAAPTAATTAALTADPSAAPSAAPAPIAAAAATRGDAAVAPPPVLLLPGWLDSDAAHWQSRWQALHGDTRVEQHDWQWPRRGDWMAQLDATLLGIDRPVRLVSHSLGCQLVAAWAAHSSQTGRVLGALLVAPPDTERADMPPQLHGWRPIPRRRLPFRAVLLYSEDDPYCAPARALGMAADWGAEAHGIGALGHINGSSGLGDWPEGRAWLERLHGG